MARAAHYSLDLVVRCRSLLDHLMEAVEKGLPDDEKFGGALTTTFLVAMANPIIGLPIERIFKPGTGRDVVADDRALNDGLSREVKQMFNGKTKFKECPFLDGIDWRFVRDTKAFNIAEWNDQGVLEVLSSDQAREAAGNETVKFMMLHLRNAIAHGGIVYLDKDGRLNEQTASMLAFVSARMDWDTEKIVGLHISRISEPDFRKFLTAWADWIEKSGVSSMAAKAPPLAA